MNQITRLLIALTAAVVVHAIYWWVVSRRHGIGFSWWNWTARECQLRSRRAGVARMFIAWAAAHTAFAFVIEDAGVVFTFEWFRECILMWDWVGVLVGASILTFAQWRRVRRLLISNTAA